MVPLEDVQEATHRLVRAVDGMRPEDFTAPSLLPGWSRAHVVAHLALNAEALGGVLRGVSDGHPVPMYASQEARDRDIEEAAATEPGDLRSRLLAATTELARAVKAVADDAWGTRVERTPGGRTFAAGAVPGMRELEVEIHLVDLGLGHRHTDWRPAFAERLVGAMVGRLPEPLTVVATDLPGRSWSLGPEDGGEDPGPTVSGPVADLGWWLTGRRDEDAERRLSSDRGALPAVEGW